MQITEAFYDDFFKRQFQAILESGADLNQFMPCYSGVLQLAWRERRRYTPSVNCYDILGQVFKQFYRTLNTKQIGHIQEVLKFLLSNGLSYFYDTSFVNSKISESLFMSFFKVSNETLLLARGIPLQLLVLGYGRSEVHTVGFRLRDAGLDELRHELSYALINNNNPRFLGRLITEHSAIEIQSLIEYFDSGPLTLQQFARIAIRRAVGGADFARRVRSISACIPPLLFQYVAEASEYLLDKDELKRLTTE